MSVLYTLRVCNNSNTTLIIAAVLQLLALFQLVALFQLLGWQLSVCLHSGFTIHMLK